MTVEQSHAPFVVAGNLVKLYGEPAAADGVDFEIGPCEVVGFLEPNGAGTTTTIRMLTGSSPRTSGRLDVFGLDVGTHPREIKAQLGSCRRTTTATRTSRFPRTCWCIPATSLSLRARPDSGRVSCSTLFT